MLGSAGPATATLHTSTSSATPSSPTRPSRLRGLSYLRSYTHNHLHSNLHSPLQSSTGGGGGTGNNTEHRFEAPPLARRSTSPGSPTQSRPHPSREPAVEASTIETVGLQEGENGWLPTVQGRSGLSRESLHPTSTSQESASPDPPATTMTRSRAATAVGPTPAAGMRRQSSSDVVGSSEAAAGSSANPDAPSSKEQMPAIRFIPHVDPPSSRSHRPSLHFTAMSRTLKTPSSIVRVGRYSERDNHSPDPNTLPVGFKSKVVSRRHCEFWYNSQQTQWYVRDVKSSSGTFLNHVRLSPPGQESRPYAVNDGDVVQLGIDFKGGEEVIFRCVKIRVECNRSWQKGLNSYNTVAHKRLLKHAGVGKKSARDSDAASVNSSECSICLNPVRPCQALFVAPCGHVWHYKFVADLEADVEPDEEDDEDEEWEPFGAEESEEGKMGRHDHSGEEDEAQVGGDGEPMGGGNDELPDSEPTAVRTRGANIMDEELAGLLDQTSLQSSRALSSNALFSPPPPEIEQSATSTQPMTITARSSSHRSPSRDLLSATSTTPPSNTPFALATGGVADGPMTPRNDAGPFVLDGSAGRERYRNRINGVVPDAVEEESEPGSPPGATSRKGDVA